MRVNMSMLYDGLKTCVLCEKGSAYNKNVYVDDVSFSKKVKAPSESNYVLIDWNDYDQKAYVNIPPEFLILAARDERIDPASLAPCALVIYSTTSLSQLFEICREIMRQYFQWGDEILSLIMKNASLPQLLDCAHDLLKNPMMILDDSMKVLAYTSDDPMEDEVWKLTVEKGYADLEGQSSLVLKNGLTLLNKGDAAYNHPMHYNSVASAKSVTVNNKRAAIVSLIQNNHKISEGDFACLCYFGDILSLYFKSLDSQNYLTDNRLESIILDILSQRFTSDTELYTRLRNVDWIPKEKFYVLTIQSLRSFLNPFQLKKISDTVVKYVSESYAVVYDGKVVVMINHNKPECLSSKEIQNLTSYLIEQELCAGLSGVETKIRELARLQRQALAAIDMGNYLGLHEYLYRFNERRFESMIYSFIKLGDTESYLHPCIKTLEQYDKKRGASLLQTLISYVDNNCKQVKTAQDLFIQRGTVVYRIKKIEDICQIDLRDTQVLFDIQLSLNLYSFLKSAAFQSSQTNPI